MKGGDRSADSSGDTDARRDREARTEVEAALAREYRFQEQLSQALVTDVPEQGIADVLHDHLGLA